MGKNSSAGIFSPLEFLFAGLSTCPDGPFHGLHGAIGPLLLARLALESKVTLLLTADEDRARRLHEETRLWLGRHSSRAVLFLPDRRTVYDQTPTSANVSLGRVGALSLSSSGGGVVIAPIRCALDRFFQPKRRAAHTLLLKIGTSCNRNSLLELLAELGFDRVNLVTEPGQFAVRGSLIDLFPADLEFPVRLDFFGDELESIKVFSPSTQRTIDVLKEFSLRPSREHLATRAEITEILERVEEAGKTLDPIRRELLQRRSEHLQTHPDSRDLQELRPFLQPGEGYLWDHWSGKRLLVEQPEQCFEILDNAWQEILQIHENNADITPLQSPESYYHPSFAVRDELCRAGIQAFNRFQSPLSTGSSCRFHTEPVPAPSLGSRDSLLQDLQRWTAGGWAVGLIIEDEDRYHNIKGLLGERHFPIRSSPDPQALTPGTILVTQGVCGQGFLAPDERIAVLGEQDIYGLSRPTSPARLKHRRAPGENLAVSQLIPGDFVVHVDHGIAEYQGIQTLHAAGNEREYLLLQYSGSDKLYVPVEQIHKVQKYIGMEGFKPSVHSLNSKVWDGQKRRVQKNVELIAKELLELYAKREAHEGFAFPPDCEIQDELERKFPYEETPDQEKAILETKLDMQKQTPMDRLICGDVGFGKTEVALRAAFKAVCAGKQVAILAPTTLLAFQHEQTFKNRLSDFPVQVGMVSRLVKPRDQKELLLKAKDGRLDILIGTHRLLSSDIGFKDLGLLVVDEEQRFGVKSKERLKQLRTTVDVLTLTATPIPRTMQMALSGIRQISVIDTPPEERRPIQTYVAPFEAAWAKRSIVEELRRGGQVYYVFNRVEKIEMKAAFLRELVPEARIVIAHGQMEEELVEKTMLAFIRKEFDVLLSTTIIESGLDIPNVNTMIVEEAERLGLSQMYQLRGRVGRSYRQAFAIFFYSKGKKLTREAQERLATIEEHTALGSGFKVAMRDLQIRGAGNLLGEAQSGHIAAIGFALYMELLEEAVKGLRGQSETRVQDTLIEIPFTALLPKQYIPDDETRISFYSRLARCRDLQLLELLRGECEDRFGTLPSEAQRLLRVVSLRIKATRAGVLKITKLPMHLKLEFDPPRAPNLEHLFQQRSPWLKRLNFMAEEPNSIMLEAKATDADNLITQAGDLMEHLSSSCS